MCLREQDEVERLIVQSEVVEGAEAENHLLRPNTVMGEDAGPELQEAVLRILNGVDDLSAVRHEPRHRPKRAGGEIGADATRSHVTDEIVELSRQPRLLGKVRLHPGEVPFERPPLLALFRSLVVPVRRVFDRADLLRIEPPAHLERRRGRAWGVPGAPIRIGRARHGSSVKVDLQVANLEPRPGKVRTSVDVPGDVKGDAQPAAYDPPAERETMPTGLCGHCRLDDVSGRLSPYPWLIDEDRDSARA
jgi:hypothetical protein